MESAHIDDVSTVIIFLLTLSILKKVGDFCTFFRIRIGSRIEIKYSEKNDITQHCERYRYLLPLANIMESAHLNDVHLPYIPDLAYKSTSRCLCKIAG